MRRLGAIEDTFLRYDDGVPQVSPVDDGRAYAAAGRLTGNDQGIDAELIEDGGKRGAPERTRRSLVDYYFPVDGSQRIDEPVVMLSFGEQCGSSLSVGWVIVLSASRRLGWAPLGVRGGRLGG